MRWINFLFAALILLGLLVLGSMHQPFGSPTPPLGVLLSPYTGFWQNAESVGAGKDLTLDLPGLSAPVAVVFDERSVPHVFAEKENDLFFVQGYITARDRLWQMDITIRDAAGRLSEVIGPATLERDRRQRRKGMMWAARNTLADLRRSDRDRQMLEAYTAGVNAYINSLHPHDYPIEFKLLNYAPEPWTLLNSVVFYKKMAETLCFRHDDLAATNTLQLLGRPAFDFLFPEYHPAESPVIPETVEWNFDSIVEPPQPANEMISEYLPFRNLPQPPANVGSNNWAVSGAKTAAGHPILCGDPHLNLTLPSIWYEIQLSTPEWSAYGVSFPGLPSIPIGFNRHAAWSETNVSHDVLDWYRVVWADSSKTKYWLDGQLMEVKIVEEPIEVKGRPTRIERVKYTYWGPVVYEDETSPYRDMAMHWIALDDAGGRPLSAFFDLMTSETYDDYYRALSHFGYPAQNFVFANRAGDIALTANGKLPVKRPEQGRFVQDGSVTANGWQAFIPYEQIPRVRNPERGFVASANQRSTGLAYPYYYNGVFEEYRGRYINRRLAALDSVTVEDMAALQLDDYSLKAEENLPLLLARIDRSDLGPGEMAGLALLEKWNYRFPADGKAGILFEAWFEAVKKGTFDELYALRDSMEVLIPEPWRLTALLDDHPGHVTFDLAATPEVETAAEVVTRAFREAYADVAEALADADTGWAEYQGAGINHLGRIPAFSVKTPSAAGCKDAPNALKGSNGPSWRMIVELADTVRGRGVFPGGPSGNPGSPFYDNTIEAWAQGEYYDLWMMTGPDDDSRPTRYRISFNKN